MKKVVYAVVGSGFVSQFHFVAFGKMQVCVKYVCDLNEDSAKKWCEKFNAAFVRDCEIAFADPEVNVVLITTSTASHYKIAKAAILAGKAVICEKTLGVTPAEAAELIQLARKQKTLFYTSYMKRYMPAVVKAKELLFAIGKVTSAYFKANQFWGIPDGSPATGDMIPKDGGSNLKRNVGGGILLCGGSHVIDTICYFFGRPLGVMAMMHYPEEFDVESNASLLLRYADTPVQMLTTMHPLSKIGYFNDGWDEVFRIDGQKGYLEILSCEWKEHTVKASILRHYDQVSNTVTEYRFDPGSPFEFAERAFAAWIAEGVQGEQEDHTGYTVDAIIGAAFESDKTGKEMKINWIV